MPLEVFEFANTKTGKLRAWYVTHAPHFSHKVKTTIVSIGKEVNNNTIL
jgi:hypothetical protein